MSNSNFVMDLSAFLLDGVVKVGPIAGIFETLSNHLFSEEILNLTFLPHMDYLCFMPDEFQQVTIDELTRERNANAVSVSVAISPKDFRNYTNFSVDDEDDFI